MGTAGDHEHRCRSRTVRPRHEDGCCRGRCGREDRGRPACRRLLRTHGGTQNRRRGLRARWSKTCPAAPDRGTTGPRAPRLGLEHERSGKAPEPGAREATVPRTAYTLSSRRPLRPYRSAPAFRWYASRSGEPSYLVAVAEDGDERERAHRQVPPAEHYREARGGGSRASGSTLPGSGSSAKARSSVYLRFFLPQGLPPASMRTIFGVNLPTRSKRSLWRPTTVSMSLYAMGASSREPPMRVTPRSAR